MNVNNIYLTELQRSNFDKRISKFTSKSFMRSTVGLSAQCNKVYYSAIVTKLMHLSIADITFLV